MTVDRETLPAIYSLMQQTAQMALLVTPEQVRAVADEVVHMDSVMPIIDPTGYKQILQTAQGHRDFIDAFARFHGALERIKQGK